MRRRIENIRIGDVSVWADKYHFELSQTNSWVEDQDGKKVIVVEAKINGDVDEARKHLEREFDCPIEIRPKQ